MADDLNASRNELKALSGQMDLVGISAETLTGKLTSEFGQMTASIAKFASSASSSLSGVQNSLRQTGAAVNSQLSGAGKAAADFSKELGSGLGEGAANFGAGVGESMASLGSGLGDGLSSAAAGLGGLGEGLSSTGDGLSMFGGGLSSVASGLTAAAAALPAAAAGMMAMAATVEGITPYVPQIMVFVGTLGILALLGEGLAAAGSGILGIGSGLFLMAQSVVLVSAGLLNLGAAFPAVNAGMLELINGLMNTQINIGGIITFVLLAASMFIMAKAIESINENLAPMVVSMGELGNIFTTGLMVGITVFAVMMLLLSLALGKVATGIDKVTKSFKDQYAQLLKNIPLLATAAILSNPIVGAITVALATAAGFALGAVAPKMATGGVVSSPTIALVGEGRYPEAVVPLGDSPQFADMKADIASAVLQGISAIGGGRGESGPSEVVLTIDGDRFARAILPAIDRENRRRGVNLRAREA